MSWGRKALRRSLLLCAITACAIPGVGTGVAGAASSAAARKAMPDDFSGVYIHSRTMDPKLGHGNQIMRGTKSTDKDFKFSDGSVIPLKPDAEKLFRTRVGMSETDAPFATTESKCLPIGMPSNMMGAPYPIQIFQKADAMTIEFEEGWGFRLIYIGGKHPDEIAPSFFGHSIAHWEGKTLVIETIGFRDDTTMGGPGLPHSADMKVTERLSRMSATALIDKITVTDPTDYYAPLTFTSEFDKTDDALIEYICENSRISVTPDGRQTYGSH
jgi:hypothetical protein